METLSKSIKLTCPTCAERIHKSY